MWATDNTPLTIGHCDAPRDDRDQVLVHCRLAFGRGVRGTTGSHILTRLHLFLQAAAIDLDPSVLECERLKIPCLVLSCWLEDNVVAVAQMLMNVSGLNGLLSPCSKGQHSCMMMRYGTVYKTSDKLDQV